MVQSPIKGGPLEGGGTPHDIAPWWSAGEQHGFLREQGKGTHWGNAETPHTVGIFC